MFKVKNISKFILLGFLIGTLLTSGFFISPHSYAAETNNTSYLGGEFEVFPLTGYDETNISSMFGGRIHPITGQAHNHSGIDIAVPSGTPIHAVADGTVVTSTFGGDTGNYIVIYHGDSLYTEYMHQSERVAQVGDIVKAGDIIGYVGSTGDSTGPHLHFGVVQSDHGFDISCRIDPYPYLFGDGSSHTFDVTYNEPVCIIAVTDNEDVFANETAVIAHHDNTYILEFEGIDLATKAYQYYSAKVDIISYDSYIDSETAELVPEILGGSVTKKNNFFTELDDIPEYKVAIIGDRLNNIDNSVSFTYENTKNEEKNKNSFNFKATDNIFSINIIDNEGKILLSSLYSAIEYASQSSYIILPDNIINVLNYPIIDYVINNAARKGCKIICPAGDNQINVDDYIKNKNLILIGASNEYGVLVNSSNVGDKIGIYIKANDSREASYILSDILSNNSDKTLEEVEDKRIIKKNLELNNSMTNTNTGDKNNMVTFFGFEEEGKGIDRMVEEYVGYVVIDTPHS